jgi:hypothetical protein
MRRLLIASALLVCMAACTAEQPATETTNTAPQEAARPPAPSPAEAATLIQSSMEFGEYEFTNAGWTTPVAGASMSEPVRAEARQLAAAGWIAFDGAGDVMLTDKGRNDRRFLLRQNGILDVVPIASKEFGEVQAVRDRDGAVTVDFTWRWKPNEVGSAFTSGPTRDRHAASHEATAELTHDGTKWVIVQITPR